MAGTRASDRPRAARVGGGDEETFQSLSPILKSRPKFPEGGLAYLRVCYVQSLYLRLRLGHSRSPD